LGGRRERDRLELVSVSNWLSAGSVSERQVVAAAVAGGDEKSLAAVVFAWHFVR
jgi:hypothetical protein